MVEKGTESDKPSSSSDDKVTQLMLQVEMMSKQLAEFRASNKPQAINAPAGMDNNQFEQLLTRIVQVSKEKPEEQKLSVKTFVEERDIDPADFDSVGVLFCAYSTGYLIVDDVRQGFPVSTPFGNAIFFKYEGQTQSRDSRGKVVLNTFCAYMSRSKKEQEWLRGHRYFGIKFFESAQEALSADAERAQKLVRYIDSVMSLSQDQAVLQCQSYGVPISGDMRTMRLLLANKMLKKTEEGEVSMSKKMIDEYNEERMFRDDVSKTNSNR